MILAESHRILRIPTILTLESFENPQESFGILENHMDIQESRESWESSEIIPNILGNLVHIFLKCRTPRKDSGLAKGEMSFLNFFGDLLRWFLRWRHSWMAPNICDVRSWSVSSLGVQISMILFQDHEFLLRVILTMFCHLGPSLSGLALFFSLLYSEEKNNAKILTLHRNFFAYI